MKTHPANFTTIDKIQLAVCHELGADMANAVHMAMTNYTPTKSDLVEYGSRACSTLEQVQQEG